MVLKALIKATITVVAIFVLVFAINKTLIFFEVKSVNFISLSVWIYAILFIGIFAKYYTKAHETDK